MGSGLQPTFDDRLRAWLSLRDKDSSYEVEAWQMREELRAEASSLWQTGSIFDQGDVLTFLLLAGAEGFADLVEASLNNAESMNRLTAAAVLERYSREHEECRTDSMLRKAIQQLQTDTPLIDKFIVRALSQFPQDTAREALKHQAETNRDRGVRDVANLMLALKSDQAALGKILEALRENPKNYGWALDLWSNRHRLYLTKDDIDFLRGRVEEYESRPTQP